jgi:hypothetical protein
MAVSYENSKVIFQGIKAAGIRSLSALPETWFGLLLQQAERDPDVTLIQVAKEEEAIVGRQLQEAWTFSQSSLSPVALLLTRDLMEGPE